MRRVVKRVGVGVVALVVASLGLSAVPAIATTESPDTWDPRVTKYVRFVEQHRKLRFEHPVAVEFLDDGAFVKAYQRDDPKVTKRDRAEAERAAGQLRALGLVAGPVDLIDAESDLGATTTVGFYDQERKQLSVRGTDLTDVDVRVTLVHELTHALQDQRFDLSELDDTVEHLGRGLRVDRARRRRRDQRRGRLPLLAAPGRPGCVLRRRRRRIAGRRVADRRGRALRHPTRARPLPERAVHLRAPVHRVPPRRRRHGSGRPRLRPPTPYRRGDHRPGGGPSRGAGRAGRDAEAAAGRAPPWRRPTTSAR